MYTLHQKIDHVKYFAGTGSQPVLGAVDITGAAAARRGRSDAAVQCRGHGAGPSKCCSIAAAILCATSLWTDTIKSLAFSGVRLFLYDAALLRAQSTLQQSAVSNVGGDLWPPARVLHSLVLDRLKHTSFTGMHRVFV